VEGASVARGVALATVAAILGAVAIVVLGGVFAVSAGLIAIAGATGWAVAAHMSVFLKGLGDADREAPQVPLLKLSLEFNDIAGRRHRTSYDIEFHWYVATPHAFSATDLIAELS
jgi:hypothetical protein